MSKEKKNKIRFPHVIIIFSIMVVFASILTYIIPAGQYDFLEGTQIVDPDSFHYIENTPINPFKAFLDFQTNISTGGLVISLLLILGAATEVLAASGAIDSLVNTGIKKFKDRSIVVVIPMIYLLMTVLGALCGNDSMIAYVAIGVVISKTLKLDKICAVCMFYLPYITAQAAGPTTANLLTAQSILELPALTGFGIRIVIEILFYLVGATFTTMYALKVNKDPSKSILGVEGCYTDTDESHINSPDFGKFEWRALLSIIAVIAGYVVYAVGAKKYAWSWNYLTTCIIVSSLVIAILYRMKPNDLCGLLMKGAMKMGGVCFLMGFARTISATLTNGNILHTIANAMVNTFSDLGATAFSVVMLIFNALFNFIVVGGVTQAQIVLPITLPIGDIMGVSREVMSLAFQLGDGLTNCLTPLSLPLVGALALADVPYSKWVKFIYKIVLVNIAISIVAMVCVQVFVK